MKKPDVLDLTPDELIKLLAELGQKPYRARQLLAWIYQRNVLAIDEMTDMPLPLREALSARLRFGAAVAEQVARGVAGHTAKYLFRLDDGNAVEAVSMKEQGGRHTLCISSQVGCALGCTFCATGGLGFRRNLTTGEILFQVIAAGHGEGEVKNVVFMGMGEPLLNVENVLRAVQALTDPTRFALGTRKVTVSTAGIIPGIERLAESGVKVHLALSLNSPFQEQREKLMPIARKYPLAELLASVEGYGERSGKPALLEYVLLEGINTGAEAAREVARIAGRLGSKVNLIEYNPVEGIPFRSPSSPETLKFRDLLMTAGVTVTIRFRRGRDIAAGCGQLAAKKRGTTDEQG